jgi:DNA helicase-2/ATP-dependent DNA helicase PcrA
MTRNSSAPPSRNPASRKPRTDSDRSRDVDPAFGLFAPRDDVPLHGNDAMGDVPMGDDAEMRDGPMGDDPPMHDHPMDGYEMSDDPNGDDDFPFDLPPAPGRVANANVPPPPSATPPPASPAEPRKLSISERARGVTRHGGGDPPYLAGLNPEQRAAVEALDGPVLVLAGAGTGKTRVLTTRIAHILASGRASGHQILAVTFTNKAAREMKHRIAALTGEAAEGMPWLGTFHAIGVKILRRHHELVGLKSGFTIVDVDDQLRLMKQVIEAAGIDKDRWPARQLAAMIDGWKNRALSPDKVPANESYACAGGKGQQLYADYQRRLKELNACDFGDLLVECIRLFRENPDILADYQRRFRFILVDEYQDTNVAQYLWLRLLAQKRATGKTAARDQRPRYGQELAVGEAVASDPHDSRIHGQELAVGEAVASDPTNICCVGDDDQSIYGWRGAEVDNILRFDKDFPGATVIRLERNYRSTGHILATASALIARNTGRLGKTLFTDDELGAKVVVSGVWDDEEEARGITEEIEAERRAGTELNEIAILVRASFQMRAIEDRLVTTGLPYRVIGGPKFYERQEIKDAVAYLEITVNPSNDLKFERIVNVPKRGLGDGALKRLHEIGRDREIPLYQAAREATRSDDLPGKARRGLADLMALFERWRAMVSTMPHTELAELILDESGYTAMWQADKSPQAQSRLENLKELVRFMHEFDSMQGFLEHVSLVMDAESADDGDRVSLMTLHAAKGLEFDVVFLPGFEEGLFPHQRSLDESGNAGLEEERRLAYVGITRAKKRARISFAQNRRNRGLYQSAIPSRFVDELPEDHVEVLEAKSPFGGAYRNFGTASPFGRSRFEDDDGRTASGGFRSTYDTPGWQRAMKRANADGDGMAGGNFDRNAQAKAARGKPANAMRRGPVTIEGQLIASSETRSIYKSGERVFHDKFGYGTIAAVEGNKLTIDFEKSGRKSVVDSFVERH